MHDDALWPALLVQDVQDVVVALPIMDGQGAVMLVGHAHVGGEHLALHLPAGLLSAPVVDAGLSDGTHMWPCLDELVDPRQGLVELAAGSGRKIGSVIGVDGHRCDDPVVAAGELLGEP